MMSVSDTGVGISEDNLSKVFEPFFTTKKESEGTGLGLSTCYGIVKQSGGDIQINSETDVGTTVKIYFPRAAQEASPQKLSLEGGVYQTGDETILVVEDEASLRKMVKRILSNHGYTVIVAGHGEEALRIIHDYDNPIDLVITDVIMPRMGGKELSDRIQSLNDTMKILFMSGYTDQSIVHQGVIDPGVFFIQKPFTQQSLLKKVRDVLDH